MTGRLALALRVDAPSPAHWATGQFFFSLRNHFLHNAAKSIFLDMTDTKPKDVCDTVDYGHVHVGKSVCVRLQRCREVLGVCCFSCDSMTREPSHSVPSP